MQLLHGNLKEDWPMVRAGIERIMSRESSPDYIPEDLYHSIKSGASSLYVNESRSSFIIIQRYKNGFTGQTTAKILMAYACKTDRMADYSEAVEALCREAGCTMMECETARTGFSRLGWTKGLTIYTRSL